MRILYVQKKKIGKLNEALKHESNMLEKERYEKDNEVRKRVSVLCSSVLFNTVTVFTFCFYRISFPFKLNVQFFSGLCELCLLLDINFFWLLFSSFLCAIVAYTVLV